jgi:acetolactate synthase-1/2/3 large subunit
MTAADLLLKYLEQFGVKHIFGIPGGALEPLYAAIERNKNIEAVLTKHEQGAAFMADGYARVSRSLGVCCATTGPGSTNLITGVASAFADSIPVLVITAQVPTKFFGKGALQESTHSGVDIVDIFKSFTKYSAMVMSAEKMTDVVTHALRIALSGRMGPVHINIPKDVFAGKVINAHVIPAKEFIPDSKYFSRGGIKKAAALLIEAKKPAILVGNGVLLSDSTDNVVRLAELLCAPVTTTPKAKGGFPENHPLSLGVFGLAGSPLSESYLLERKKECAAADTKEDESKQNHRSRRSSVDLLITLGTSLNEWGTHAWDSRLIPDNGIIQVDIDPYEFGKNYPFLVDLMGDAKVITRELTYEVQRQLDHSSSERLKDFENRKEERGKSLAIFKMNCSKYFEKEKMDSEAVPIKPQRLMKDINNALPKDAIVFVDIGNNLAWATHYLDINLPNTYFAGVGFASMGYGVAAAIGAKFASPKSTVVAIVGDGGFLMNGMEVATAVNYDKQVIWIVENNSQLGMVKHSRKLLNIKYTAPSDEFKEVDFVSIAKGLGAKGLRLTKPGEINRKLMEALIASGESVVLDVVIDNTETPPFHSRIRALSESI